MQIHDYHTTDGKNVIKEYLSNLPENERVVGYGIRHKIVQYGLEAIETLNTRQLRASYGKLSFLKIV